MAIEVLKIEDVRSLSEEEGGTCVSLYMPMARAGKETLSNPTRLKNLMREAGSRLEKAGMDAALLEPLTPLMEDYHYWQNQEEGLAVFVKENLLRTFRLPFHVDELVVVGGAFHLKPLLPFVTCDERLLLLALSQNAVVLYAVDRNGIEPIDTPSVPKNIDEALQYDDPEKSLQVHTSQRIAVGNQAVMTHGQGIHKDVAKDRLLRYFRRIDEGLHPHLKDRNEPLVLAAVDYYPPIYGQANTYPHLASETVSGNPETKTPGELYEAAWGIIEQRMAEQRRQAAETAAQALADGGASNDLEEAVAAAAHGRVDTCFVALDEHCWGRFDADTAKIELPAEDNPDACDLLDFVAVRTLLQGGRVFAVPKSEIPGGGVVVARLRY